MAEPISIPSAASVKVLNVNGGNLFRVALDNLGDPLQWNRIAASNHLLDPFLPVNSPLQLVLPPINAAADASGILRPNVGVPIFAAGRGKSINATSPPTNVSLPTIVGVPQVGHLLTVTPGTWTVPPSSESYQWARNGVAIDTANSNTYIPVAADVNNFLTVSAIAVNSFGPSIAAISLPTSAVIDIPPTINTSPSIPSVPMVGSPIMAIDATWNHSVTSRVYQWKVAGVNGTGAGATTLTYTPVIGDLGQTLTITVTAINSGGSSLPSTSAASAAVIASAGDVLKISLQIGVCSLPIAA